MAGYEELSTYPAKEEENKKLLFRRSGKRSPEEVVL